MIGECANGARLIGVELHFLDRLERLVKEFVVSGHLPNTAYSDDEYMESLRMLEDLTKGRSPETIFEPRKYNIETETSQHDKDLKNHHDRPTNKL